MSNEKHEPAITALEILGIDPKQCEKIIVPQYAVDRMAYYFLKVLRAEEENKATELGLES